MPSLKKSLLYLIQSSGEASLDELHELGESLNKKQSNVERTLRLLSEKKDPNIEPPIKPMFNTKNHITGYYYA